MKEMVVLVNERDEEIGVMEKIEAHEKALLHRAFSVFIFNKQGEMMIQRRALDKYHSPGLWTNTCCSHQRKDETNIEAGKRRLQEEMGFQTDLKETTSFIYKSPYENGLTEHEFDHLLIGHYEKDPSPSPQEVADWKWAYPKEIWRDLKKNPEHYTTWFYIIFDQYYQYIS